MTCERGEGCVSGSLAYGLLYALAPPCDGMTAAGTPDKRTQPIRKGCDRGFVGMVEKLPLVKTARRMDRGRSHDEASFGTQVDPGCESDAAAERLARRREVEVAAPAAGQNFDRGGQRAVFAFERSERVVTPMARINVDHRKARDLARDDPDIRVRPAAKPGPDIARERKAVLELLPAHEGPLATRFDGDDTPPPAEVYEGRAFGGVFHHRESVPPWRNLLRGELGVRDRRESRCGLRSGSSRRRLGPGPRGYPERYARAVPIGCRRPGRRYTRSPRGQRARQ
jgi:hypothetical protein